MNVHECDWLNLLHVTTPTRAAVENVNCLPTLTFSRAQLDRLLHSQIHTDQY